MIRQFKPATLENVNIGGIRCHCLKLLLELHHLISVILMIARHHDHGDL